MRGVSQASKLWGASVLMRRLLTPLVHACTPLHRDEPTSGLDSAAAYYVMAAVRRLAEHCRTVIRQAQMGC